MPVVVRLLLRTLAAIAIVLLVHLLGACSSAPKRIAAPSVASVQDKISAAQKHVAQAQTHAAAAKENLQLAISLNPEPRILNPLQLAQTEVDALTKELLEAQSDLQRSEILIVDLQHQVDRQTEQLNDANERLPKLETQARRLTSQRNKLVLLTLAAAAWIFRQPLIGGVGFIVRKFIGVPW